MDFKEFRSGKVWIPISFGPDGGPKAEFSVAYRPAALTDEDAEFLAQLEHARVMEYQGLYERPDRDPPVESRPQRRARERAQARAAAVPEKARQQAERPTYIDFMKRLIVDWDLTWGADERGEPVPWPVCEESFRQIEYALRIDIVTSIMLDYLERPNLSSLSKRFSAATTASGQTGQTSASEPSNGELVSFPGTTPATPNGVAVPSGATG